MARDRSPLSQRLKSLAQRAGRPGEEDEFATASGASTASGPEDEQPTGEVPVVAEQPTDEQPALTLPPEPVAPIAPASESPADQPTLITNAVPAPEPDGPTMSPPVLPPREEPASPELVPSPDPAPAADAGPADAELESDEPFSGGTVWPQSSPTPRFEPAEADEPKADAPTFPESSPEPEATDLDAATHDEAPTTNAAALAVEIPSEPAAKPDPTAGAALAPPPDGAKAKRAGGLLGRLRPARDTPTGAPQPEAAAPSAPAATRPTHESDPRPAILPPSPEPPEKPTFGERAALRRRAKSLRARRDAGLLELGAIVLDQRRFGDPTGGSLMRRRTDELADIDSELAAIEQVLDDDGPAETVAQLGVVRCLTCTALLGPRDRFCVQCGAPRPEDAAPTSNS
ncbi:MAG: hypothetical protein J7513_03105 [Solirubrobacteraceae bacterium]|nr:hypothetical protein [Solirubrobacteraceae bacterium]